MDGVGDARRVLNRAGALALKLTLTAAACAALASARVLPARTLALQYAARDKSVRAARGGL